ncbi:MAG: hypothetical protein Q8O74_08995 [bacterium]|nr:hypothetical protein [bacterium]
MSTKNPNKKAPFHILERGFSAMKKNQKRENPGSNTEFTADKTLEDALKLAVSGHSIP